MDSFAIYLVKSSLCIVLFYLFYKILLSRETFFRFNRYVLLSGISICLILPFITIKTNSETIIQQSFVEIKELIIAKELQEENVLTHESIHDGLTEYQSSAKKSLMWYVGLTYILGFCLNLMFLTISIIRLISVFRLGDKVKYETYTIVKTQQKTCPFSFGTFIVIPKEDYLDDYQSILYHEIEHIKRLHSIDLIFMELIALFLWFNPAIWLLKRELEDIHEYEADNGVIQTGINATKYQLLLVKKAVGSSSYAIANSFNHSKLKKRITMMLKEKSNSWAQLKVTLLVPVAAVCLLAFARTENQMEYPLMGSEITTNPQDLQQQVTEYISEEPDSVYSCVGMETGKGSRIITTDFEEKISCENYDISVRSIFRQATIAKGITVKNQKPGFEHGAKIYIGNEISGLNLVLMFFPKTDFDFGLLAKTIENQFDKHKIENGSLYPTDSVLEKKQKQNNRSYAKEVNMVLVELIIPEMEGLNKETRDKKIEEMIYPIYQKIKSFTDLNNIELFLSCSMVKK